MSSVLLFSVTSQSREHLEKYFVEAGYRVRVTADLYSVRELMARTEFDAIVADVDASGESLRKLQQIYRDIFAESVVLVITAQGGVTPNVLPRFGAELEMISKPISKEQVRFELERMLESRRLRYEAQSLRHERSLIHDIGKLVAVSRPMKEVLSLARKVARSDSTVLLTGETGTGKELVAGAIHYGSPRAKGPFVKLNCAALPGQLLESELFGHEKGAFTGAERQRTGRFEHANTGSIFLDEIGDMSIETQAKLLRVVQEREFQRLGSNRTIRTDVRIIAATNKQLEELVQAGDFREDLFYRLNVITIDIPPLRERNEDILPLVDFFARKLAGDLKRPYKDFTPEAINALLSHSWPGNIRELKNVIERGILMSDGERIGLDDLGLSVSESERREPAGYESFDPDERTTNLKEAELRLILDALEQCDWVQKDAAKLLGVSTRVLNHKIRRFGIRHPRWRRNR